MNPYLEARWGDVHTRLCAHVSATLQPELPTGLRARAEERVLLSLAGEPYRVRRGDTVLVQLPGASRPASGGGGAAVAAPLVLEIAQEAPIHRWVQIVDTSAGGRVVTVIEILSPANKGRGKGNKEYVEKVREYLSSDVNFVEIDLLRSSRRRLALPREALPPERRTPYLACVNRPRRRKMWELYPMPLREPLPTVMIPCRETDPDVPLALQPLIDRIYVEGGHDDIDYTQAPPRPRLSEEDQAWVAALVGARQG